MWGFICSTPGAYGLVTLYRRRFSVEKFGRLSFTLHGLVIGLLWAAHPLQTEPVSYVTQRTELMMAFFLLATLLLSRLSRDSNRPTTDKFCMIGAVDCVADWEGPARKSWSSLRLLVRAWRCGLFTIDMDVLWRRRIPIL